MEFATDVVGDDAVQRTAGEALYNTLSYAVRPTLSVCKYTNPLGNVSLIGKAYSQTLNFMATIS